MKGLSVIMPVYNGADCISTMIDSVMAQDYKDLELIVIDDGSIDDTVRVVERYAARDRRIRLAAQPENKGVSAARNLGLDLAEREYVAFVDADDRIHSSMYGKLIRAVEEYDCDMAMCRIFYEKKDTGTGEEEVLSDIKEGVLTDDSYRKIVNGFVDDSQYFFAGMVRYIFRKRILRNCRFDTRISYREDMVFLFELLMYRRKIYYADFVGYYYVRSMTSAVERYKEHLFEDLMYVNGRIFAAADQGGLLDCSDRLRAVKVLEAVSISVSNLYRKEAPKRKAAEYFRQIRRFRRELDAVKGVGMKNCAVKYRPLLFLAKIRADWAIHVLYRWKEKNRQRKICSYTRECI